MLETSQNEDAIWGTNGNYVRMTPLWLVVSARAAVVTLVRDHLLRATEASLQLHEDGYCKVNGDIKTSAILLGSGDACL